MTTVLFVHGTGVRAADYESNFTLIARKLQQYTKRTDLHLARCLWGEQFGAHLQQHASIPLYNTTRSFREGRSAESPGADDVERMLWGLLYQDPLYELRLLALKAGEAGSLATVNLNIVSPGETLDDTVRGLAVPPESELQEKMNEMGIAAVFFEARRAVVASAPYRDVLQTLQEDRQGECGIAIARALVQGRGNSTRV